MSRRAMVVAGFMGVLLLALIALDMWYELKDLPSLGYVWREFWRDPELIALAGFFSVIVFLVLCTQSVGLGRWGKVGLVAILVGVAVAGLGWLGLYAVIHFGGPSPATSQQVDRLVACAQGALLAGSVGLGVCVAGCVLFVVASAVRTWRHRKRISLFPRKGRE